MENNKDNVIPKLVQSKCTTCSNIIKCYLNDAEYKSTCVYTKMSFYEKVDVDEIVNNLVLLSKTQKQIIQEVFMQLSDLDDKILEIVKDSGLDR